MCILAPQCSCRLPIFVLLALNSISVLGTQLDTLSMEGMRLLKMVHYRFKDLQIYFALEIFGNLPQLKVDTKISLSQSILHFSRHSFYLKKFFFQFSVFISPCVLIKRVLHHTSFLLLCVTQISWPGAQASTSLACEVISAADGLSLRKKGQKDMRYPVF